MKTLKLPVDRIVYFSDAIFAIAITLLVLEIKIPSSDEVASLGASGVLRKLMPSFTGFLISFLVTGLYWRAHLIHCQFIKVFDGRLLWINLLLLLFVVLLPFSTAFYSKNFGNNGTFIFYGANLVMIGIFTYLMIARIGREGMHHDALDRATLKLLKFRAALAPLVWLLSILIAPIFPLTARFFFIAIFVVQPIADRWFLKNHSEE